ncbi:hypothetical protein ACG7TL_000539 [Trametes sanguinea]
MPPCTQANTILARVRGQASALLQHTPQDSIIAFLDAPIAPKRPLCIGDHVRILSITPCNHLFPAESDDRPRYIARSLGIVGTVVGAKPAGGNLIEFTIRNENERSTVTHAIVTIKHEQGITTQLGLLARLMLWIAAALLVTTRTIPLQRNAVIFNDGPRVRAPGDEQRTGGSDDNEE